MKILIGIGIGMLIAFIAIIVYLSRWKYNK